MTRPYPVSVAIRALLHKELDCGPDHIVHTDKCNRLHDGILFLMQRYGLPGGPPIRHQPDPMND